MYSRLAISAFLLSSLVPTSLSAQIVEAGIVRDAVRGAPYECLHVALLDSAGKAIAHTVTDSAGRFLLEAPRPGAYRVQFNVFLWEPLAGPVDTLKEGDSRQRAYPLAFRNMLAPDSTALPRRPDGQSDGQEYRRRYQVLQAYAREQESDSGWRSRSAIPRPINLRYPDWLRRSGVDGSVLGEFIVDSTGTTRPGSWHAIAATHPDFEAAVVRSIPEWRWRPARIHGAPVCELTFDFIQFTRDGGVAQIWLATRL
jgi:hypothetical protein